MAMPRTLLVWMDLSSGAPPPQELWPVDGARSLLAAVPQPPGANGAGRRSLAGAPLRREASRDFQAAFYGAESGSEKQ